MDEQPGATPRIELADWSLKAWGQVEEVAEWSWPELQRLARTDRVGDLDCDEGWSDVGRRWSGVPTREILSRVRLKPEVAFVIVHGHGGYRANFSLHAFAAADAILAYNCDDRPLAVEQGWPLRLVAPGQKAWKSVKQVEGLEFLIKDWPGTRELSGEPCKS